MALREEVLQLLRDTFGRLAYIEGERSILRIKGKRVNVRTATQKNAYQYWFDVTPDFYERGTVDFFLYACGAATHVYVFPRQDFKRFIAGASLGGQKQVPNFTIYADIHKFEPAGHSDRKHDIRPYLNAYSLISES